MNAAQKDGLFWNLFAQLDSDQPGERESALGKIHSLREKMGWSRFIDLRGVSPEKLAEAEKSIEQWMQAHAARVTENAALARRNAVLVTRNATLRSALFVMLNWRMIAVGAVAAALLGFGGWCMWDAEAAPDKEPVAADGNASLDAALGDVLSRTKWGEGDSAPMTVRVNGFDWWVVVRGTVDLNTHVDAQDRPVERRCLQLFASEAVRDQGAFLAPAPYAGFGWMRWPQRAVECRMPGKANYK